MLLGGLLMGLPVSWAAGFPTPPVGPHPGAAAWSGGQEDAVAEVARCQAPSAAEGGAPDVLATPTPRALATLPCIQWLSCAAAKLERLKCC